MKLTQPFKPGTPAPVANDNGGGNGGGFALIPQGTVVPVVVVQATVETMKSGAGEMLCMRLDVTDGPFSRRVLWPRITLSHETSDQAVEIGEEQLSALCLATHIGELDDTDDLIGKRLQVVVGIEKGANGYADRNVVKRYQALPAPKPAAPKPAAQAPVGRGRGVAQPVVSDFTDVTEF